PGCATAAPRDTHIRLAPAAVGRNSDHPVGSPAPPLGILPNSEGHKAPPALPTNVYRVDTAGRASVVTGDVPRPNGLAFSPDESRLYVVASGDSPRTIRVFDVVGNGTALANGRVFVDCGQGVPDGFRCDTDGNLWCGWGGGGG